MIKLSPAIKRALLDIPLKRPSPNRIPRSGDAGAAVNCFSTRVMRSNAKPLIVEAASGNELRCLAFDGDRYSIETTINFADLLSEPFEFTHYYGLATITYRGWRDLAIGQIFRWPYIMCWVHRAQNTIYQGLYNRRKLVTRDRIELLKTILDAQLNGRDSVSSLSVMSLIHSDRWFFHPNSDVEHHKIKLYLDALVETKELRRNGTAYQISGSGISAIELYEEQERMHAKSMSSQRKMVWLTLVIVLLTIVQAGLLKLPPILDLTGK